MTKSDKQELEARVHMAYEAAAKLTKRRRLQFRVARLFLGTLTTPQIAALAGWRRIRHG